MVFSRSCYGSLWVYVQTLIPVFIFIGHLIPPYTSDSPTCYGDGAHSKGPGPGFLESIFQAEGATCGFGLSDGQKEPRAGGLS